MVDRGFPTKITKVSLTLYSTFASKLHLIAKKDAHSVLEIVSDQSYLDAHFQLKFFRFSGRLFLWLHLIYHIFL